jgi:hypothetical protein
MKRACIGFAILALLAVSLTSAFAGGDKVRGENGQGDVNQVNFDAQGNQN